VQASLTISSRAVWLTAAGGNAKTEAIVLQVMIESGYKVGAGAGPVFFALHNFSSHSPGRRSISLGDDNLRLGIEQNLDCRPGTGTNPDVLQPCVSLPFSRLKA
jgi:hypothetical protein